MKLESNISERSGFLYIAPVLDGVLLLLVFFVLGSTFVSKSGVQVTLPTSNSILPDARQTHIVTIMDGSPPKLFFNDSRVDIAQFKSRLKNAKAESNQITILADKDSRYGAVMEVSLIALKEGFDVAYGTQSTPE